MADKIVFPKQQLEIVQVQEPKSYSGGSKFLLPVMAKNLSLQEGDPGRGKSWKYTVFNQALQDHIKPLEVGTRFLCDIEERERPDSEYGPDRNIVQIYVDGKPVSQKTGGGGGGWKGRSLEEDLVLEGVKRRSIEGQHMASQVGALLLCDRPLDKEKFLTFGENTGLGISEEDLKRIVGKYWQAVEKGLDNYLAQPKPQEPAPKRDQRAQDTKQAAEKTEKVSKDAPPTTDPIKHVGDLLTRAGKLKPPVNPAEVATACGVTRTEEIKDLEECWKKVQEFSATKAKQPDLPF